MKNATQIAAAIASLTEAFARHGTVIESDGNFYDMTRPQRVADYLTSGAWHKAPTARIRAIVEAAVAADFPARVEADDEQGQVEVTSAIDELGDACVSRVELLAGLVEAETSGTTYEEMLSLATALHETDQLFDSSLEKSALRLHQAFHAMRPIKIAEEVAAESTGASQEELVAIAQRLQRGTEGLSARILKLFAAREISGFKPVTE